MSPRLRLRATIPDREGGSPLSNWLTHTLLARGGAWFEAVCTLQGLS